MLLYQNYQDRECKQLENGRGSSNGNHKDVEIGSIYGRTIGNINANHQKIGAGSIGGSGLYGTHHERGTSGSVLSHPGSNNNGSIGGLFAIN